MNVPEGGALATAGRNLYAGYDCFYRRQLLQKIMNGDVEKYYGKKSKQEAKG